MFTCNETEITPRQYPRIKTIEVFNVNQEGASFKGEIYFSSVAIIDHGFLIAETKNPTLTSAEKISLGIKNGIGEFSATIDRSLATGKKYYIRAYVISEDHTVYGEVIEFTSLGSKAPSLKKIFPDKGTWRDTVYLIGENFSELSGKMEVKFGTHKLSYTSISTDSISVNIPLQLINKISEVSIKFDNTTSLIEDGFTLLSPEIISVTPQQVILGETITITGSNFNQSYSIPRINGVEASIVSRSATSIQAKVPTSLSTGSAEVVINIGNELVSNSLEIQIEGLQVFGIEPTTGTFNDIIKIKGERFGTNPANLNVLFENHYVDFISLTDTEIQIKVPSDFAYPTATIEVSNNFNQRATSPQQFSMRPPTVESAVNIVEDGENYILIEGTDFWPGSVEYYEVPQLQVYLGNTKMNILSSSTSEIKVRRDFIPSKNEEEITVVVSQLEASNKPVVRFPWIQLYSSPGYSSDNVAFKWPDEIYLGIGRINYAITNKIWQFNPVDYSWTQTTSPLYRYKASSFVHNDKGYVVGGLNVLNSWWKDYWSFDRTTQTWEKAGDLPDINTNWRGFVLNDIFYLIEVGSTSNNARLWHLDTSTNQWTLKYDLPFPYNPDKEISVNINNKHYLRGGDNIFVYDPVLDLWSDLGPTPFTNNNKFYAEEINGQLLCINPSSKEVYEHNLTSQQWKRITDFQGESYTYSSFTLNNKFYLTGGGVLHEYNPAFEN